MSNNPAYNPTDPRYYDQKDLRKEVERIFSLCADCRMWDSSFKLRCPLGVKSSIRHGKVLQLFDSAAGFMNNGEISHQCKDR